MSLIRRKHVFQRSFQEQPARNRIKIRPDIGQDVTVLEIELATPNSMIVYVTVVKTVRPSGAD